MTMSTAQLIIWHKNYSLINQLFAALWCRALCWLWIPTCLDSKWCPNRWHAYPVVMVRWTVSRFYYALNFDEFTFHTAKGKLHIENNNDFLKAVVNTCSFYLWAHLHFAKIYLLVHCTLNTTWDKLPICYGGRAWWHLVLFSIS